MTLRDPRLGIILMLAGGVLVLTGAIGLAVTPATRETTSASPGSGRGSPSPVGSPTVEPTKTPVQLEAPERFVPTLAAAIREGNQQFLFRRLHPAVLERFGDEQCRTALEAFDNPSFDLEVQATHPLKRWAWRTDGVRTKIAPAVAVDVIRSSGGAASDDVVHVAHVGTQLRWFTDCGDPIF